jgi:SAM-dependent methyltransferase
VNARRGQARHASQPPRDALRLPGRLPARRRGQEPEPEYEQPDDVSYERPLSYERPAAPPQPAAFRPAAPPPGNVFRPEPPAPPPQPPPPPPPPPAPREVRQTREEWLQQGRLQFDYLVGSGLQPGDRLLEIGCGSLSAGHLFIDYLSAGNYYGIDVSPNALLAGQQIITEYGLQAKMPHLTLVADLTLGFLPPGRFTVVQAHGVFSQAPIDVIGDCLASVKRVMSKDAVFDFTFDRTAGVEQQVLRADYYHRADSLIDLADSYGLDAELLKDWEQLGHPQSKLRVTRRT